MTTLLKSVSDKPIQALTLLCNKVTGKAMIFNFLTGDGDGEDASRMVEVTEHYTELFPDVFIKAIFTERVIGSSFILKAKCGSKIDVHHALPKRFIYVVYGEHTEPVTGKVYRQGNEYCVEENGTHGADFTQDSKLLIEYANND